MTKTPKKKNDANLHSPSAIFPMCHERGSKSAIDLVIYDQNTKKNDANLHSHPAIFPGCHERGSKSAGGSL